VLQIRNTATARCACHKNGNQGNFACSAHFLSQFNHAPQRNTPFPSFSLTLMQRAVSESGPAGQVSGPQRTLLSCALSVP
jgi:hypothetical protein